MALSVSERRLTTSQLNNSTRPRILITGGSGRIGTLVAARLRTRYDLTLLDRWPPADPTLAFVHADISQADALAPHFQGIDTVLHLAADPRPTALWASVFLNNIVGTCNVIQAACAAGCRRVVFASSLYTVLGYPPHLFIDSHMPPLSTEPVRRIQSLGRSTCARICRCIQHVDLVRADRLSRRT